MERVLQQVLERYPKEVKLVNKSFPLSKHKFARKAAMAALAANAQEKFWEFHSKLFENHRAINDAKIQGIAEELGVDMEKLTNDMRSPAIQKLIARDVANGEKIGIRGIPTVFINGKILRNRSLKGFQQEIETELKKSK